MCLCNKQKDLQRPGLFSYACAINRRTCRGGCVFMCPCNKQDEDLMSRLSARHLTFMTTSLMHHSVCVCV